MSSLYPSDDTSPSSFARGDSGDGHSDESFAAKARDGVSQAAQTVKDQASAAAGPVADQAKNLAEERKDEGAGRIDEVAKAVHGAADEIGKQIPQAATYIHSGADQLQRASRLLRDNSVDELLKMTNRLAHDRPLAFIGGSVAAGFVLSRFLRSSSHAGGSGAGAGHS